MHGLALQQKLANRKQKNVARPKDFGALINTNLQSKSKQKTLCFHIAVTVQLHHDEWAATRKPSWQSTKSSQWRYFSKKQIMQRMKKATKGNMRKELMSWKLCGKKKRDDTGMKCKWKRRNKLCTMKKWNQKLGLVVKRWKWIWWWWWCREKVANNYTLVWLLYNLYFSTLIFFSCNGHYDNWTKLKKLSRALVIFVPVVGVDTYLLASLKAVINWLLIIVLWS